MNLCRKKRKNFSQCEAEQGHYCKNMNYGRDTSHIMVQVRLITSIIEDSERVRFLILSAMYQVPYLEMKLSHL